MASRERTRLLREFGDWAKKRGLSADRHEAQFRGNIRDTPISIESGIRDSNLYVVVLTFHRASGIVPCVLRGPEAELKETAAVIRLRELFRSSPVLSIHVDPTAVTVRMPPGTSPDDIGPLVDAMLFAMTPSPMGAYR